MNKRYSLPYSGDPDSNARQILGAGGLDFRQLRNFALPSSSANKEWGENDIPYADVLRGVYGASDEQFAEAVRLEFGARDRAISEERPHIFGVKSRFRQGGRRVPSATSRLIGETEFAEIYAAAEFAAKFDLWFDTTVTINWRVLGVEAEAEKHFLAFTKCVREWLPSNIPYAAIYAHECNDWLGLHTHLALYVNPRDRRAFREWAMGWAKRRFGQVIPRAMRVRVHSKMQPWLHWVTFSYFMKGYDPQVVVRSARNAHDEKPIYLADLIAAPFRDPGPVPMKKRVGSSLSLMAAARMNGVPGGMEYLKRYQDVRDPFTGVVIGERLLNANEYPPFRSVYEDGHRDIRVLYSREFLDWYDRPNPYAQRFPDMPSASAQQVERDEMAELIAEIRWQTFGPSLADIAEARKRGLIWD